MPQHPAPLKVLIALGGNAILKRGEKGTSEEQFSSVRESVRHIVKMIEKGDRVVVTHGNGPQVGDILLRNEAAKDVVPPMPLDVCGAESQGMIGYMLQQALEDALRFEKVSMPVVTILTQTMVDPNDPAFANPSKPIGPFYTKAEASALKKHKGWKMVNDSGRGFRRVVPSPRPVDIVEKEVISKLYESGALVIAAGGGGIPVVLGKDGRLRGVEAVLDKDRTAALLATLVKADILLILTDVEKVYLDYQGEHPVPLTKVDVGTMKKYLEEGQFPPGSMGPKIESAVRFVEAGGKRAVVSSLELAEEALAGRAGTTITSSLSRSQG